MNYLLLLIILAMCGAGYYEYTVLQQKDTVDQQQFNDLNTKVDALQAEIKKMDGGEKQAPPVTSNSGSPAPVEANSPASAMSQTPSPAAPATTPSVPPPSNDLGTIVTPQQTYQNCHLLKVHPDGIVIQYPDGITNVKFVDLGNELQKRFGYDPQTGANLTPEQVAADEQQRAAAGN